MTYLVLEGCIRCKYMDCVEVCPVDCFHEGENMLVIDPTTCIDCGACEPECPLSAIVADSRPEADRWISLNAEFAQKWPQIARKGTVPADADAYRDIAGKLEKFFSPEPGKGR
jgi:ferredoxin